MIALRYLVICFFVSTITCGQTLKGKIVDNETNEGLDYVTIRVVGKNIGTISSEGGFYEIDLSNTNVNDSLKFTYIGYEPYSIQIRHIVSNENIIRLSPKITELNKVVVTVKNELQVIGAAKASGRYTGWGDFKSGKGRIRGLLIDGAECPVKVKSLSFRINHNDWDSVAFRINFLKLENNKPSESILNENIFVVTNKKDKWVKVDLDKYNIVICEKIVASLEWVDSWGTTGEYSNQLTISLSNKEGHTLSQEPGEDVGSFSITEYVPAIFLEVYGD